MKTTIDDVLASIDAATTSGGALDAIPDDWRFFVCGPDEDGFASSILPAGAESAPKRHYERGLAMGRGATRLEAMRAATAWLRTRMPAELRVVELAA